MIEPQPLRSDSATESGQTNVDLWRNEIQSRVAGFRTRRARRIEGAFSMRFPFLPNQPAASAPTVLSESVGCDPGNPVVETCTAPPISSSAVAPAELPETTMEPALAAPAPELRSEPVVISADVSCEAPAPPLPEAETELQPVVRPRPRPKRKVIAFPRQPEGDTVHGLADPVRPEQPRILDVPEELEAYATTPFLDGLQFEPAQQAATSSDHIELPFRAITITRRIYAALLDCSIVIVAAAAFAWIGHKMLPDLVLTKPARLTAAALLFLLWAIYQYLLVVYAGKTAGMRVAGTCLSTFKGRQPSFRHRRNRVLGLYLSTTSLAMGLLWAVVDVDSLCWHDRISGTYLTGRDERQARSDLN